MTCYRLQVHAVGGLPGVTDLVPYLDELGVSTLYLSPVLRARSGSTHGYDVVDPGRIDPAIGAEPAFDELGSVCADAGLTILLDIVPNHMAASHENPWWWSVMETGPSSPHGDFFDVDWDEPIGPARGRIVLPILGRRYYGALESGELQVIHVRDGYLLKYYDHVLPLDISSHPVLASRGDNSGGEREAAVNRLNRAATDAGARADLDLLLTHQPYWLVHWRTAPEELNYRRFFNISHLIALRMERETVFRDWHRLLPDLVRRLPIGGIRVDHVDGLSDPEAYLDRLRKLVDTAADEPASLVLLVEKILAHGERLPKTWNADGTTGYDFLAAADGVLVSASGVTSLRRCYGAFTSSRRSFVSETRRTKRKAIRAHFRRDLARLVDLALPVVRSDPRARDLARSEVASALQELTIEMRVYRTYLATSSGPSPETRAPLDEAAARARRKRRDLPGVAFDVLTAVMTQEPLEGAAEELVRRWQQLTGAVTAKGVEDTAFYAHTALVSLNEVGSDPESAPIEVDDFHALMAERAERWPRTLNTTSTHDTKRSEDVRARLHVLSEMPGEWEQRVGQWHEWNHEARERVRDVTVPTAEEEWLLYQTLVGVWPLEGRADEELLDRLEAFLRKAAREAKVNTSWIHPNAPHEEALIGFMRRILGRDRDGGFMGDLLELHEKTAFHGALNSLSLLLLKLGAPGTPDLYQGNELWRFSLVDPDNRRPVDWHLRQTLLEELRENIDGGGRDQPGRIPDARLREILANWTDGRIKLLLTWRGLACRRRHETLFREGSYEGVEATGHRSGHVIAFARRSGGEWVLAVAPRLTTHLTSPGTFPLGERVWEGTEVCLPEEAPRRWTDAITGETLTAQDGFASLPVAEVLERFPVALLYGSSPATPSF
ncbi:MAG: malto-oligosyltrehalose synthase [Gemmatimonadota bacterium]